MQGVVYCWGRADNGQLGIGSEWVHETTSGVVGVEWPARVGGLLQGRRTVSISVNVLPLGSIGGSMESKEVICLFRRVRGVFSGQVHFFLLFAMKFDEADCMVTPHSCFVNSMYCWSKFGPCVVP